MAGPNLAGLIGRKIAGDPAFDYSPVLRAAGSTGTVWTAERLLQYLSDTEAMFPGTWMSGQRIPDEAARKTLTDFIADPKSR
jgi:cytochrome c